MGDVIKLRDDPRCMALCDAIKDLVYERGKDIMTIATALGYLEVAKFELWQEMLGNK